MSLNSIMIRVVRLTGWLLLVPIALYLLSGWCMSGTLNGERWMSMETAMKVHSSLDVPFLALLAGHVVPSLGLAIRRWRSRRNSGA